MRLPWYRRLSIPRPEEVLRLFDQEWDAHRLGPPERWPEDLVTVLRLVFSSAHPMYVCWGPELICLHNLAFQSLVPPERRSRLFGVSARTIWADLWPEVGGDFERALHGEPSFQTNRRFLLSRDGAAHETFWTYSYTPIPDSTPDAAPAGVLVVCSETTPTVAAARSADDERKRLTGILDQAPAFVAVLRGPDFIYEFSNAAHDRLVAGRSIIGKPVLEALPELLSQGSLDILTAVFDTGEPFLAQGMLVALKREDADTLEDRYLDFIFQRLEPDGDDKRILVLGFDMTDRTRAEQALREARAQADASNVAKSQFLANMSHELRTPMNAIVALGYVLETSDVLDESLRRYLSVLRSSADSLLELIDDLLDASQIEARGVRLEERAFPLAQVVREVAGVMHSAAKSKGLEFRLESDCVDADLFIGDPRRVRQILTSLCGNAIKFTEAGSVRLTLKCGMAIQSGEGVQIDVEDTGIGIPSSKVEDVFQAFVQADASTTRKFGGAGLGLSLVKALTSAMSGTINVSSEMGRGTRFTVQLPLRRVKSDEGQSEVSDSCLPAERVLVVEDYEPNAFVTTAVLQELGYEVVVARSGAEAVDLVQSSSFRAILMDVQMPEMDGLAATRRIRDIEKAAYRKPTRIIGFTAYALESDRERCLAAGMDDYLAKPARPHEIRQKLLPAATVRRDGQ